MSGTPGTINSAQASSGCQGVSLSPVKVLSQASNVPTKAAQPMAMLPLAPPATSTCLSRKARIAAMEHSRKAIQSQPN